MISIEDFQKIDIRVGKILSAEKVEGSNKLLKLSVDLGEERTRQIVSGIAKFFPDLDKLLEMKCMFVANLEPKTIYGLESEGMILAVSTDETMPDDGEVKFSLLMPNPDMPLGAQAR